jgi:hypothetical protein
MKSRGCLLVLILVLACSANSVSAQTFALWVQVYDFAGLSPGALREFTTRTEAILASSGVSSKVVECPTGAAPCESPSGISRRLAIRVLPDTGKDLKKVRTETLGMSIAGPKGGTYATVFLKSTEEKASDLKLSRSVVLAYAAAHEIGHLLLGCQAHTAHGLMKAVWDTSDFQAMSQNSLRFSPEQTRELVSRYGHAATTEEVAAAAQPSR